MIPLALFFQLISLPTSIHPCQSRYQRSIDSDATAINNKQELFLLQHHQIRGCGHLNVSPITDDEGYPVELSFSCEAGCGQ